MLFNQFNITYICVQMTSFFTLHNFSITKLWTEHLPFGKRNG